MPRRPPRPAGLDGGFSRYEAAHRALVDPKQANVAAAATLMVPATRAGITARNMASRLWPAAAAAGWARNLLGPRQAGARAVA
ncbi:hypothetical protein [Microbispora sp. NBRC 16548]|uniref:hypothetical protein n=1 Tax=Microbispora sp. NBRC 16548 TaxID=3030994 RepID=UPI0024A278D3|nr:hypothetical protein [Microbispora sp. NBRC 16548]GLX11060.1 hypothetical protein Misp03_79860 [Microbispora sp. NBRC 16548]